MLSSQHDFVDPAERMLVPLIIVCLFCCASTMAQGLQPHSPQMPAPPPMKFISRDERAQLNGVTDPKAHTRLAIDLASDHLTQAEQFTNQKKYEAAAEELGRYVALINWTLRFLSGLNSDKGKTRDLYRHLDITLRGHIPRLAVMRRSTPVEYAINLKAAEDYIRTARSDVLDSFYGHTVLGEDADKKSDRLKNQTSTGETKHP